MILRRGDIVDFLVVGQQSLVLTPSRCLRLARLPTTLLSYLEEPRSLEQVRTHLVTEFGPAPEDRLQEVLDDLIAHGVIRTAGPKA